MLNQKNGITKFTVDLQSFQPKQCFVLLQSIPKVLGYLKSTSGILRKTFQFCKRKQWIIILNQLENIFLFFYCKLIVLKFRAFIINH